MSQKSIVVANDNPETITFLCELFQFEGYEAHPLFLDRIRSGRENFDDFLAQHNPSTVLFDIGWPYKDNWELFKQLRASETARNHTFVVTSLGRDVLVEQVGEEALEVFTKSHDIPEIVRNVVEKETEATRREEGEQHFRIRGERGF